MAGSRAPAQVPGPATVHIYGRSGSFGGLSPSIVPSGHSLARHEVPGSFPAGHLPFMTNVAADGTVFMGGMNYATNNFVPSAPTQAIGTFDPATGTRGSILNQTSAGVTSVVRNGVADGGASVADVRPIRDGQAMAFTSWTTMNTNGSAVDGVWPAFGIMTKVGGQWQVASGTSGGTPWRNQWTGAQLSASSAVGATACPLAVGGNFPGHSECRGLNEMAELPSGDIVTTQYVGANDANCSSGHHGGFAVVRPGNPDGQGRFSPQVVGHYQYPDHIEDTTTPAADCLSISPIGVEADPTSTDPTDQRFVAMFDMFPATLASKQRNVIQEFSFDGTTGTITPVSAPILPGDLHPDDVFWGFSGAIYDQDGNLWTTRNNALASNQLETGGKLAVFAKDDGERKLVGECAADPNTDMGDYRTTDAGLGLEVWGMACQPDHDIVQANSLGFSGALMEDPVSGAIVSVGTGLFEGSARVLAVLPSGEGDDMSFEVGNVVDLGTKLLPNATPTGTGTVLPQWSGGIDGQQRLWMSAYLKPGDQQQCYPLGCFPLPNQQIDSWLYSVDIGDLLDPPPTPLPAGANEIVGIHAEQTSTVSTTERAGSGAEREFDSDAYFRPCKAGCTDVDLNPGDGYFLADDGHNPFGLLGHTGGPVQYEVTVPSAGSYRIAYYVSTLRTSGAVVRAQAASSTVNTDVSHAQPCPPPNQANPCPDATWRYVTAPANLTFPAAGTYTLTLSAPVGAELWSINWFTLTRQ